MLKKILFAGLLFANFSAYSQFNNTIGTVGLPQNGGIILDVIDYNNDGFEDVIYQSGLNGPIELYRNTNGVFANVTTYAGLPSITGKGDGTEGVISFDYNGDGFQDILLTNSGANGNMRLFKNNCGANFTDATGSANLPAITHFVPQYSTNDPIIFPTDYDKDGDIDLVYCRMDAIGKYWITALNNGGGSFSTPSDLITSFGTSIIPYIAVFDYDNDGDEDFLVIKSDNISNASQVELYDNSGTGIYTVQSSIGISNSSAVGFANILDYNADGYLDVLFGTKDIVNPGPGNLGLRVFRNNGGNATFTDVTSTFNTQAASAANYYASHIFDMENDGDLDVLWEKSGSLPNSTPALMSNNGSNVFADVSATQIPTAITNSTSTEKYVVFDYNNDGALDIFQPATFGNPSAKLFKNPQTLNNFITLRLQSCTGLTDPIGARVYVKAGSVRLFKQYNAQGISTTGPGKSERMHFGLGSNNVIDTIIIYWPSGSVDTKTNISSNQNLTFQDGVCSIGQPITFDLGPDTNTVCNADTAYLLAPGGFESYTWSTGDITPDVKITTKGWYYCTVTNINGCGIMDSVYVAFGIGKIIQPDTSVCLGTVLTLDASPRFDCGPFGAPVKRKVNAGDDLGPRYTYVNSLNGHHYYLINNASTWSQAESEAVSIGGHLAVINDQLEQDFINNQPTISSTNLWIGLYKTTSVGGEFRWVNCDTLEFTQWASAVAAPTTGVNENFVYIRAKGCPGEGEWKNTDETVTSSDPCERNIKGLVEFDDATNISYLWSNGDTTASTTITATSSTNYNVKITQPENTCFGSINLNVIDPNNLLPSDSLFECKSTFTILQATPGYTNYQWNTGSKNSFIFVSTSGSNRWYTVSATSPEGCLGKDSIFVTLFNAAIRTPDTTVCLGSQVFLRGPTPTYTYINSYTQNFQSLPYPPEWSKYGTGFNFNGSRLMGPFANDSVVYNMTNLPIHDSVSVSFDLYIHDTWEGECSTNGKDRFRFKNGLTNVMNTTFSNTVGCNQAYSYVGAPGSYPAGQDAEITGLSKRCDNNGTTSKYTITKTFRHSATDLDLSWVGELTDAVDNTGKCNESWSIDNVMINLRRPGGLLWSTGDTEQNIFVKPVDPVTEYWVRIPVGNSFCYDTVFVSTVQGEFPGEMFFSDTIRTCGSYSVNFSLPDNFDKYVWSTGDVSRTTTFYNEGWYRGYVETTTGCYDYDSIYLLKGNYHIIPQNDTALCIGSTLTVKADLGNGCSPFGPPANIGFVPGQSIPGYTFKGEYLGHHYYMADTRSSWSTAAQLALASGGHLAIINDTSEQNFIASIVDSNAWLGLYKGAEGYYKWMNCDTLTYTNWALNEPTASPDDYVFMMSTGCPEAKKWDAHTDDDMTSTDPCYSSIYGLLEIMPYQYVFDWRENGVSTYNTDSFTVTISGNVSFFGTIQEVPGGPFCGTSSIDITVIDEGFEILIDSVARVSCEGDTAMIEAKPGYSNYHWNNGDTTRIAVYSSYIGWAYCMYDNGYCQFTDSVYVNVPGKFTSNPSVTDITCYGANDGIGNAGITGGTSPFSVLWLHNNSTNTIETNLSPGVYYYTVTDSIGCSLIDSITITNPASPLTLSFTQLQAVKCNGDSNGVVVPLPLGGEAPYTGIWIGTTYVDTLWNAKAGVYTYTVTDTRGCVVSLEDTLTEPTALDITGLITSQIYCPEDSNGVVFLAATGGINPYTFVWKLNPIVGDTAFKVYNGNQVFYVVDANFCFDSIEVNMQASNPDKCGLIVPSGFTPNNDGMNDLFYIKGLSEYPENELTIFNRWGETVFQATNYKNDWNGKPMNKTLLSGTDELVPNDTYYFVLYTKANNKTTSGYVYITK